MKKKLLSLATIFFVVALAIASAEARITKIVIDPIKSQSPTFEGAYFGDVGQYEKIVARAYGEVDPQDAHNSIITDINLAPTNTSGKVEYSMDLYILKPVHMSKGSGKIFYEVVNRGSKLAWATFNQGSGGQDPKTAADAGTGLLMRLGYTIVWSGWESSDIIGTTGMTASLPVAKNPDGTSIVGQTIFEQIFDNTTGTQFTLVYRANTTDQNQATMLVRNASEGPRSVRQTVPTNVWQYVDNRTVRINRNDPFLANYDNGAAYELIYYAKDPVVLGLGFAATRDVVSFLRYDTTTANPVHGAIRHALGHGASQSGRYLKGFTYWGFNEDESGRMVFDGINPHISGAHAIAANDRWGDNNATGRKYQRHTIAKMEFPFTYEPRVDPYLHETDGIFERCQATGEWCRPHRFPFPFSDKDGRSPHSFSAFSSTCPKVIHTDSGNEPYLKPTCLVTTNSLGHDIVLPDDVRVFVIGSTQHGPASLSNLDPGICQQLPNPNNHAPHVRALFVALDAWATRGVLPPESLYGKVSDGTLVRTTHNFPVIPHVTYTGWINPVAVLDKSSLPYTPILNESYTVLAPKTDADGNDIPGVRTVNVQVPLATYTGWGLRKAGYAENEDCGLQGQYIPFAATRSDRLATGDPRLSIQERYKNHSDYVRKVTHAVHELVEDRLILSEDAKAIIDAAEASSIP